MAKDHQDRQSSDPALNVFSALLVHDRRNERVLAIKEIASLLFTAAIVVAMLAVRR